MCSRLFGSIAAYPQSGSPALPCVPLGAQRVRMHMLLGSIRVARKQKAGLMEILKALQRASLQHGGNSADSQAKVHEGAPQPLVRLPRGVSCKAMGPNTHHT